MASKETVKPEPIITSEQLAEMKSFDDAVALLSDAGIEVHSVTDFGDGFLVQPKSLFENVPFVILNARMVEESKYGTGKSFAVLHIMTRDGRKAIFTDGSTGICDQVTSVLARGKSLQGAYCERGLVASHYDYPDPETGQMKPATTYYIQGL